MQRELGKHWHSSCSLSWGPIHPSSVDFLQAHCLSDQLCSSILIILLYVDLVNCLLLSKHLYFVLCLCWLTCFLYSIIVTLSAFQTCWHCISYQLLTDFYNIYPLCPWFVNGNVTAVDRVLTMCVSRWWIHACTSDDCLTLPRTVTSNGSSRDMGVSVRYCWRMDMDLWYETAFNSPMKL